MKPLRLFYFRKRSVISPKSKIYPFSIISNSFIDDFSYISYSCKINNCAIGKFCSIGQGVKIGLGTHPTNFISTSPIFYSTNNPLKIRLSDSNSFNEYKKVIIGHDVWIGANVTIIDGISIGDGAIIGANSVVTKNVEAYSIVGGVPAKFIRNRFSNEEMNLLIKIQWWNLPFSFFRQSDIKKLFSDELKSDGLLVLMRKIEEFVNGNRK